MPDLIQPPAYSADSKRVQWVKLNRSVHGGGPIPPDYDPDAVAFANTTGATDIAGLSALFEGWKALGLWSTSILIPMKAAQNYGTGSTLAVAGGLAGSYAGTLTNGPTWGSDGIHFDGSNDYIATNIPDFSTAQSTGASFKCAGSNAVSGIQSFINTRTSADAGIRTAFANPASGVIPAAYTYSAVGSDSNTSAIGVIAVAVGSWGLVQTTHPEASAATGLTGVDTTMKLDVQTRVTAAVQTNRGGKSNGGNYTLGTWPNQASELFYGVMSIAFICEGKLDESTQNSIYTLLNSLGYLS